MTISKKKQLISSKLSDEQIRTIRSSSLSDTALSKMFSCARGTIHNIKKFKIYKDVV